MTNIDLHPLGVYLTDYFDVKSVNGWLTSNIKIIGDMKQVINVTLSGNGTVTDLSLTDGHSEKIFTTPKVTATIDNIDFKSFHFGFGKIELNEPHLLIVRDRDMTNLERLLLPYFRSDSINSLSV